MNLNRIGDITSELSANLVRAMVFPGGLLSWLKGTGEYRDRRFLRPESRPGEDLSGSRVTALNAPVVLLGGAPVPDEAVVEFMHMAGGRSARIAVLAVAAESPEAAAAEAAEAARLLTRFGMRNVDVIEISSRTAADSRETAARLVGYDAILLCGTQPLEALERLLGTELHLALRQAVGAGKPLAGLEAGAVVLGDAVLTVHQGEGEFVPGLGLLPGLLIDTAFTQQSRFVPLVKALNAYGATMLMGAGIDAGAALVIRSGEAKVLGEGSATFLDGSDESGQLAAHPGSAFGSKFHVLMDGYGMNLRTRRPFRVGTEVVQAADQR